VGLLDLLDERHREPAECVIHVDGREIDAFYPMLREVRVETARDRAGTATLVLETRRDEHGRWTVQDAGVFVPWAAVRIDAAFGSHREEIMRGFVREVQADYPEDAGETTVTVHCQDLSLALDRQHRRRAWGVEAPTSDRIIVDTLLAAHGLAPHPDNGPGQDGLTLHQDSTDIRFLRARAEANGYELIFHGDQVYFGPLRVDAPPQETLLVYAGPYTHCHRFQVRADGHRPERVIVEIAQTEGNGVERRTVDPDLPLMGPQPADSRAAGLDDFAWRMSREGGRDAAELLARAQRRANESSLRLRAQGSLDGSLYGHVLRVGLPVPVDGVGDWLSGIYYVDRVSHRFTVDGYRQEFELLRNAYGDNVPDAGGVLSGVL